jgi:tetratricopeptide (TPR) repeat protein
MRLNETAQVSFEIDPEVLNESFEAIDKDMENKIYLDLGFQVKLVEIENTKESSAHPNFIFDLNEFELFNISIEHKNDGNILYKNKLIRSAFQRYQKAIHFLIVAEQILNDENLRNQRLDSIKETNEEFLNSDSKVSDQEFKKKMFELKSQLYCNIAACQLKSGYYNGVVKNCTKCLEIGGTKNSKALFRRAQAYSHLKDFDEAIVDLKLAISMDETNQELKNSLINVEKLKRNYFYNLSTNLKKMF